VTKPSKRLSHQRRKRDQPQRKWPPNPISADLLRANSPLERARDPRKSKKRVKAKIRTPLEGSWEVKMKKKRFRDPSRARLSRQRERETRGQLMVKFQRDPPKVAHKRAQHCPGEIRKRPQRILIAPRKPRKLNLSNPQRVAGVKSQKGGIQAMIARIKMVKRRRDQGSTPRWLVLRDHHLRLTKPSTTRIRTKDPRPRWILKLAVLKKVIKGSPMRSLVWCKEE
jgi:hypothetical protein